MMTWCLNKWSTFLLRSGLRVCLQPSTTPTETTTQKHDISALSLATPPSESIVVHHKRWCCATLGGCFSRNPFCIRLRKKTTSRISPRLGLWSLVRDSLVLLRYHWWNHQPPFQNVFSFFSPRRILRDGNMMLCLWRGGAADERMTYWLGIEHR